MTRPAILSAKLEKLAEIVADGQQAKRDNLVVDARTAQENAAAEVLQSGGSVADVEDIDLPTERL